MPQLSKTYRGTVEEVFSLRNEIPPGAMLELKVFEGEVAVDRIELGEAPRSDAHKELRARGSLAGVLNSEEFMRRKHEDVEREDEPIR